MSRDPSPVESASETRLNEEEDLAATLDAYLEKEPETEEQKDFNMLSVEVKLARLNQLVQKSQVYSQIILDNMLEKSIQKKRMQERIDKGEVVPEPTEPNLDFSSLNSGSESNSESELLSERLSESESDLSDSEAEESGIVLSETEAELTDGTVLEDFVVDDDSDGDAEKSNDKSLEEDEKEEEDEEDKEDEEDEEDEEGIHSADDEANISNIEVIESESEDEASKKESNSPTTSPTRKPSKSAKSQRAERLERLTRLNQKKRAATQDSAKVTQKDVIEIDLNLGDSSDESTTSTTTTRNTTSKRRILECHKSTKRAKMTPELPESKKLRLSRSPKLSRSPEMSKPSKGKSSRKKEKKKKPRSTMSKETASTKHAIEAAQTSHKQNQPILVSGCTMKDYQLDGLEWLIALYENGLNGILADEMGLGKTLQCIALIAYLLENGVKGPFLVVAPLSTVPNWCREFARFAPKIKVLQYTGSKDYRKRFSFGKALKAQVVVTSYDLVIKDIRKFQRPKWTYLTVDEGHRLKNFNCTLIRLLKKLDVGNRLLLTGTPLQNNLKELWSLLNFILPDIFHDLELFELWFDFDNLEDSVGDTSHEEKRLIQEKIQELFVKNLHSVLKPFLLRRIKKDVMKGLPPKKEYILFSSLTPMQSVFYKAIMDDYLPDMVLTSYIKEYALINYPKLFKTKEDLNKIDKIILQVSGNEVHMGPKRFRRSRYDKEDIERMLNGDNSDILANVDLNDDDDNHYGINGPVSTDDSYTEESQDDEDSDVNESKVAGKAQEDWAEAGLDQLLAQYEEEAKSVEPESPPATGRREVETTFDHAVNHKGAVAGITGSLMGVMTPESEDGRKDMIRVESKPDAANTDEPSRIEESSDNETFYSVNEHSNNEVIEILSDDGDHEHLSEKDEVYKIIKGLFNKFVALVKVMPLKNKIMQMRKVCNTHLSYFNPYEGNNDAAIAKELMETSGKFQMLLQLLRRLVAEGHKVLVFSQFTTALDYIRIVLDNEGFLCNQFDGRTKHEVREEEIEEFSRDGPDSLQVFLLSTRSGGLGINLVKADTVILFDNDWNPQMDIQAIDRAHRIGQARPVKVFRFVVRQTVEELLILRSFSKRLLERMVIQDGDFHLGGVARKLAEKNIEISSKTKMSTILELSEKFNLQGSTNGRKTTGQYNDIVLQPHSVEEPLTVEEMDELMDRSDAAYTRSNFSFANVTTFETSQLETQS